MGTMSKSALVIYATAYGHAELIARRIADAARGWNISAAVQNVDTTTAADLARYESVVIVASVHYGHHQRSITRFVKANRARLEAVHSAFISVSGDAAEPATLARAEDYVRRFLQITGWAPTEHLLAAGGIAFSRYNFLVRFIVKRTSTKKDLDPKRDYDYTDWEAVLRFARAFLTGATTKVA